MIRIGERCKGPRLRPARSGAAPGAKWCHSVNGRVLAGLISIGANRGDSRDYAANTPRQLATGSAAVHSRSHLGADHRISRSCDSPPSSFPFTRHDGGRRTQRRRLKQAPLSLRLRPSPSAQDAAPSTRNTDSSHRSTMARENQRTVKNYEHFARNYIQCT